MKPQTRKRTNAGRRASIGYSGAGLGGGGLTSLFGGERGAEANQPVSPEIQTPGYTGPQQYYAPNGEVVTQPFADQSNWWNRNVTRQPNVAAEMNRQVATSIAQQQALGPLELQQARELGNIARESELAFAQQKEALALENAPRRNPIKGMPEVQEPWQVPYTYQGDPQQSIYDRDQEFVGDTSAGRELNAKLRLSEVEQLQRLAAQVLGGAGVYPEGGNLNVGPAEQTILGQQRDTERGYKEAQTKNLTRPDRQVINGFLVEDGRPVLETTPAQKIESAPIMKDGKFIGMSPESYTRPAYRNLRPVGNAYKQSGGNAYTGPMARPAVSEPDGLHPYSQSIGNYPIFEDGQLVGYQQGYGEAPKTEVVTPPTVSALSRPSVGGNPDVSGIFSPEAQKMAELEYIKRLQQKLQRRAWNPVDYTNPNLIP